MMTPDSIRLVDILPRLASSSRLISVLLAMWAVTLTQIGPVHAEPSVARILPLFTIHDGSASSAWWSTTPAVLHPIEDALVSQGFLSPLEASSGKKVSRIYRSPKLTERNALALGHILGAKHVLVGTVTILSGALGPRAEVQLDLLDTRGDATRIHIELAREGFGATPMAAQKDVYRRISVAVTTLAGRAVARIQGKIGVGPPTATLRVVGIRSAQDLDQLLEHARALGVPLRVAWAARTIVALAPVDPDKPAKDVMSRLLEADPPTGLGFTRPGAGVLRVRRDK